jgi:hypothetical protein
MTGDSRSRESVGDLAEFALSNLEVEKRLLVHLLRGVRRLKSAFQAWRKGGELVQLVKVYELDGPGRASGNALTTLLNGYRLAGERRYREAAEWLIQLCIHPSDDLERRDLGDVENRWMYTVFLQALGGYLDATAIDVGWDEAPRRYARHSLLHYADWMIENEKPYLDAPEKLEFPNETWAAQELRKANVLLFASRYAMDLLQKGRYEKAARLFYGEGIKRLLRFETRFLTRPLVLLLQNSEMMRGFPFICNLVLNKDNSKGFATASRSRFSQFFYLMKNLSLTKEVRFLKWRMKSKF